jgi:light-regulated signal transduction histidine kinase (bacteriophytochrome)
VQIDSVESPTQRALRASELSYRRLFESAKDGILILDADNGRIDDLLSFSRVGRAQLILQDVALAQLVAEVVAESRAQTAGRSITWTVRPLPHVRADRALLRMALVNLIDNAIKFSGGRAEASIEIGCTQGTPAATVIFIRDNGAGFDQRYADKLFGVFQRLHSQSEFPGTGIGLANVQRIIHRHGGEVWAEGVVDRGATFFFSLPTDGVLQ